MSTKRSPQQPQRYELVTTLGKGGMAEVFLGWMYSVGGLRRRVAIKRILPELTQKQSQLFEEMFVDEARLAFQLEHDNIVRVYDVGQSANTFFIVMEYVDGLDLKALANYIADRNQQMPLGEALYISQQMAIGLEYAHSLRDENGQQLGLIHNDISPPNILCGRYGEVKIADFGLSDARSNDVETPEGMVKGKFAYISPESTKDPNLVSPRSDIFSSGIVMWEILAGRRLFQRKNDLATFKAVQRCEVPNLRELRRDIPESLAQVVARALSKDPARRQESCAELVEELTQVSYQHSIKMLRTDLGTLVGQIKGDRWEFEGERIEGSEAAGIMNEMDGMLPPGVADHLKSFVTNAKVTEVTRELESPGDLGDWIGDVIEDAGLTGDIDALNESRPEFAARDDGGRSRAPNTDELARPSAAAPDTVVKEIKAEYTRQRNVLIAVAIVIGILLGVSIGVIFAIVW